MGDFALKKFVESTGFKDYQDQLADLANGRLTFPIYYVMKHGTEQEKQAFKKIIHNESATQEDYLAASNAVHTSGAFEFGKKFIRRYYKDAKNMIHKNFPESRERGILSAIPSSIISNKFLTALKELK